MSSKTKLVLRNFASVTTLLTIASLRNHLQDARFAFVAPLRREFARVVSALVKLLELLYQQQMSRKTHGRLFQSVHTKFNTRKTLAYVTDSKDVARVIAFATKSSQHALLPLVPSHVQFFATVRTEEWFAHVKRTLVHARR